MGGTTPERWRQRGSFWQGCWMKACWNLLWKIYVSWQQICSECGIPKSKLIFRTDVLWHSTGFEVSNAINIHPYPSMLAEKTGNTEEGKRLNGCHESQQTVATDFEALPFGGYVFRFHMWAEGRRMDACEWLGRDSRCSLHATWHGPWSKFELFLIIFQY